MLCRCPHCSLPHEVPGRMIGRTGRKLRCSQCATVWRARRTAGTAEDRVESPAADDLAPIIAVEHFSQASQAPSFEELYGGPTRAPKPTRAWRMPRPSPLLVASLALSGLAMAAIGLRTGIVASVPATNRFYAALGLPVNLRGLDFRHVAASSGGENGQRYLAIDGEIANLRTTQTAVPSLRLAVNGRDGREIYSWTVAAPKPKLGALEAIAFRARLAAPPDGAQTIAVRFAAAGAITER